MPPGVGYKKGKGMKTSHKSTHKPKGHKSSHKKMRAHKKT